MRFDIGDVVVLTFTDAIGDVPTDPTSITLVVTEPDGTQTTVPTTHVGTGDYEAQFTPTQPGTHHYRWFASGTAQAVETGQFDVSSATLVELFDLADLNALVPGTVDETSAGIARRIATSLLKAYLQQMDPRPDLVPTARTLTLDVDNDGTAQIPRLLTTITSLKVGSAEVLYERRGSTLTISASSPLQWQYSLGGPSVTLTYTYTSVPDEVRDAALITAASVYAALPKHLQGLRAETERIDDYQRSADYYDGQVQAIPAFAKELLRPYRSSLRSLRLVATSTGPRSYRAWM